VVQIIALRAPMADDLREVIAALKIVGVVERIGDYAKNIAKRVPKIGDHRTIEPISLLPSMAQVASEMVGDALNAFAARDALLAEAVVQRDSVVDSFYNSIFRTLVTYMVENPKTITECAHLLFIAKNIERIGDHATNVAEMVYYAATGQYLPERDRDHRELSTEDRVDSNQGGISMSRGHMLLVEDDAALAELVTWHFRKEGFDVAHTPDGEEALIMAQERVPDIVLLDWMVENLSGIEVCRRLRRNSNTANVPIIMLTARGEEEDRVRGLETGADDYVTKPFSPRELVARVGAVLRRVRPGLAGETLNFGDIEMDTVGHKVRRDGQMIPLGPTEYRLLKHFLEHPGWVFSRERLLDSVWGHDSDIELRTVDVHIRRLRKAINMGGKRDIIRTVRSAGYALDSEAA
jgi:two-component system phosphate regulon response regulator PhoB